MRLTTCIDNEKLKNKVRFPRKKKEKRNVGYFYFNLIFQINSICICMLFFLHHFLALLLFPLVSIFLTVFTALFSIESNYTTSLPPPFVQLFASSYFKVYRVPCYGWSNVVWYMIDKKIYIFCLAISQKIW